MSETIRIGVSACVVGENVRHDRSHAADPYLAEFLSKHVEFVPLCPELACGMGVPRELVRQVDCAGDIRLVGKDSAEDWTDRMSDWCSRVIPGLEEEQMCGFVVKSHSASCAFRQGKTYSTDGRPPRRGTGFFTKLLMDHFPNLPVESEERLQNSILRENFIRRVFVMKRWHELEERGRDIGHLVDFHTRHKMLIRAHDLRGYRELGHLLGESSMATVDDIFVNYASLLFKSLALKATPAKNSDVLMHAMGYFKRELDSEDKKEILSLINAYKTGKIPLLVPVTLINHYARRLDKPYLTQQYFFNPHPSELKLLNHV